MTLESGDVTDPKPLADMLQNKFLSVFSDPTSLNIKEPDFQVPDILTSGENFGEYSSISNESIIDAISKISSDSASGLDGIPVILLKNCAPSFANQFDFFGVNLLSWGEFTVTTNRHIFRHCTRNEIVQHAKAVNYRPVALTSHIVKIYERIVREKMVKFIEQNSFLCENNMVFVQDEAD